MATDTVRFSITWSDAKTAQLYFLIDNSSIVVHPEDQKLGAQAVVFEYQATAANLHALEWSLWFAGSELHDLEARASVNGGKERKLGSSDSEENHWGGSGPLPKVAAKKKGPQ